MKKVVLMLLVGIGLTANAQYNAFYWAHNAGCRPTGLETIIFYQFADAFDFSGSYDDALTGYTDYVNGSASEIAGDYGMTASIAVDQAVYYGSGQDCTLFPSGYYLVDCNTGHWQNLKIVRIVSGYIKTVFDCMGNGSYIISGQSGFLYNWYAVNTGNLAPTGWHVPTRTEQIALYDWLTANGYGFGGSGDDIAKSMAWTSGWSTSTTDGAPGNDQGSNNASGLSFPASGWGNFYSGKNELYWSWTSTGQDATSSIFYAIGKNDPQATALLVSPKYGLSVRCIKDNSTEPTTPVYDYDGNQYTWVKLGSQIWLVQNLRTSHYNNGTAIPYVIGYTPWWALTTGAWCVYGSNTDSGD